MKMRYLESVKGEWVKERDSVFVLADGVQNAEEKKLPESVSFQCSSGRAWAGHVGTRGRAGGPAHAGGDAAGARVVGAASPVQTQRSRPEGGWLYQQWRSG